MLTIMVALNCEARPLIDFYKLKKTSATAINQFQSTEPGRDIELIVTGIGAIAMATAVGWAAAQHNGRPRVWLNVGTAGHEDFDLGTLLLVHGSADAGGTDCHYPPMVAKWAGVTQAVLSYSAPCSQYPGGAAVDMEAYAFFTCAAKFSSSELVQSIKVVSDNSGSSFECLNAARITELITPHTASIVNYSESLVGLLPSRAESNDAYAFLQSLRGTHSQRLQLNELLARITVLQAGDEHLISTLRSSRDVKEALLVLRKRLESVVPKLGKITASGEAGRG